MTNIFENADSKFEKSKTCHLSSQNIPDLSYFIERLESKFIMINDKKYKIDKQMIEILYSLILEFNDCTYDDNLNINCTECDEDCYLNINCNGLKNCTACKDCNDCSNCLNCLNCKRCDDCFECCDCVDCLNCDKCGSCSGCIKSYKCTECENCTNIKKCLVCERIENLKHGINLQPRFEDWKSFKK